MKRILIVTSALGYGIGGSEKALIEMLKRMDTQRYDISVLSLTGEGEQPFYWDAIHTTYGYGDVLSMTEPFRKAMAHAGDYPPGALFSKLLVSVVSRGARHDISDYIWERYKRYIAPLPEEYDVAIGYGVGMATYFVADKVRAKHKIFWTDTDLQKAHMDLGYYKQVFAKGDTIAVVADSARQRLASLFPDVQDKIIVVRNIVPVEELRALAAQGEGFTDGFDGTRILSVGRLCEAKAFHLAVQAAYILRKKKYRFKWYIIGFGTLEKELRKQISGLGLENDFVLLGQRFNPYPFFMQTDLYVQTSVYEGSPITIEEALAFGKPIVTTNFPAAYEKIQDGKNGIIVDMDAQSVADGVEALLADQQKYRAMREYQIANPLAYDRVIVEFQAYLDRI